MAVGLAARYFLAVKANCEWLLRWWPVMKADPLRVFSYFENESRLRFVKEL